MCWVTHDRAVTLVPRQRDRADLQRWAAARDQSRTAVLNRVWSEKAGAFDSDELDASVLILPLVGFLLATDRRIGATVDAIAGRAR